MKFFFNNSIILKRNRENEMNFNYSKIYDLAQIDQIENITFEEKKNLLIDIKKILLITNEYIVSGNILEILKYLILSIIIFVLFLLFYCPIYKSFFLASDVSINESSFLEKLFCYFFFEILEITFRIVYNNIKEKKVRKIMKIYAQNIVNQKQNESNFNIFIDNNFNILIRRKSDFKNISNIKEEKQSFLNNPRNMFYQYVINYPNVRYYNWNRQILNEKENEIADNIIQIIKLTEKEYVKKYGISVFIVWAFYILSFNNLIRGTKFKSLFYRFGMFIFTKIVSLFMSNNFKNCLKEKEELLSKQYIPNGYFIILSYFVIQIFKLKEEYVDNTLNINENFKNLYKTIINLNEKIIENDISYLSYKF